MASKYNTRKSTPQGKAATIAKRQARATKRGITTNRNGRIVK